MSEDVQPRRERSIKHSLAYQMLTAAASLRVTVVLFAFSLALVFFGTLALMDEGLHTVLNKYFRNPSVAHLPVQIFARFGERFFNLPPETYWPGTFPFPGGWLLGGLLLINLLAAHAVRFKLSWRRAGVLVLHAGLIVMMLGEVVAGKLQTEGRMSIPENGVSNYVSDSEAVELAVVRRASPTRDVMTVVPATMLKGHEGDVITHDDLPFDIKVVKYMVNSDLPRKIRDMGDNPVVRAFVGASLTDELRMFNDQGGTAATAGDGRFFRVLEKKESGGVNSETDIPTAYVELFKKGTKKSLGTYLVSVWWSSYWYAQMLERPQRVRVAGRDYDLSLRFKRTYKDYSVRLLEFHHDVYVGTSVPKNYLSRVVLMPKEGQPRESVIFMNNPMHHGGETFFQSGFLMRDRGTILQIVYNPGNLMPYIACGMIALGMAFHFCLLLTRFLGRVINGLQTEGVFHFDLVPLGVVLAGAAFLAWWIVPRLEAKDQPHLKELGRIPIVDHGRLKPLDTLARTNLTIISNRAFFYDEKDVRQPAIKWLADTMICDRDFLDRKVFSIPSPELREMLRLEGNHKTLYSVADIQRHGPPRFLELLGNIPAIEKKAKAGLEADMLELLKDIRDHVAFGRYKSPHKVFRIENDQVLSLLGLSGRAGYRYAYDEFVGKLPRLLQEARVVIEGVNDGTLNPKRLTVYQAKVRELHQHVELFMGLARLQADTLRVIPPDDGSDNWLTYDEAKQQARQAGGLAPAARAFEDLLETYAANDVQRFNEAVTDYRKLLDARMPEASKLGKTGFEAFVNQVDPFNVAGYMYVAVFLLACLSWLGWSGPLGRSAFWLAVVTLALHSFGLIARMIVTDRPFVFVTNLYSSAVFIGWGCVIVGLIIEAIFHNGIGSALAGALGYVALLWISDYLGQSGDTMEMMQAVLDTNFWLATHVTCVAIGYVATFFAGALGIIFVLLMVGQALGRLIAADQPGFTGLLTDATIRQLGQMMYGVVCFATLFSFTGTVLGGIWADQSWGRFWGWDPKENGALLIVVWNALVLHARWAGIIKQRGLAVLVIGGNMVTGWSWFGTNQLGVGLHAYGFNDTLAAGLVIFWATQIGLIVIGLMPRSWWKPMPPPAVLSVTDASPAPVTPIKPNGRRGGRGIKTRR